MNVNSVLANAVDGFCHKHRIATPDEDGYIVLKDRDQWEALIRHVWACMKACNVSSDERRFNAFLWDTDLKSSAIRCKVTPT